MNADKLLLLQEELRDLELTATGTLLDRIHRAEKRGWSDNLKQTLLNSAARLTGKKIEAPPLFKALDEVSFSIEPSEVVGNIPHNRA